MPNPTDDLIEIRCPFKVKDKYTNKLRDCHFLLVKVAPGSSGEAKCPKCKLTFDFEVVDQKLTKTSVKVQKVT